MKISAAAQLRSGTRHGTRRVKRGGECWQQRLDALPQLLGQESICQVTHGRAHPRTNLNPLKHRQAVPECPLFHKLSLGDVSHRRWLSQIGSGLQDNRHDLVFFWRGGWIRQLGFVAGH
jgi:hypothetical protein